MPLSPQLVEQLRSSIDEDRLVHTAVQLVDAPSPTQSAKPAADRLAQLLADCRAHGFRPERAPHG